MGETDMDFLLRVCEIYGRFALHQAATEDQNIKLTPQAMNLLRWTSLKVIPALKEVEEDQSRDSIMPFNDPDLSTIAVEQSFADWPASPTPSGPPRRRRDTKMTPSRVEVDQRPSLSPDMTRALATSLVEAACVVFSEWLAVSGGVGGSQIESYVSEWFPVVAKEPSMIAAMSKLALQLARSSDQYLLLQQILRNGSECNDIVRKLVSMLSSPLSKCQEKVVQVVFETAKLVHRPLEDDKYYSSWDDVWMQPNSAIAAAFCALVSNRQSLAKLIELANNTSDDGFHQQCLHLLQGKAEIEA